MEYLFILILFLSLFIAYYIKAMKQVKRKNSAIKKNEIIETYEKQMKSVLENYSDDKTLLTKEKIKLLKKINQELSMNIFFNEQESKNILKQLTNME